ncbi:MAG: hypothetical protein QOF04_762 [Solirubrobacteraceae bacterium]|jgi:hypothetical protein|nr:hypothetical protein [Solirubrobacteraceae bacterium]
MAARKTDRHDWGLRLARLPRQEGIGPMWQVVGEPFRVVPIDLAWLVVGVGDDAQRVLARHDLLARKFPTRAATVSALGSALALERARQDGAAFSDRRRRLGGSL